MPVVVLDDDDTVGVRGACSRGICYAQKSLEVFRRLGTWPRVRAKGVPWSVGRSFVGADEVERFDLRQSPAHRFSLQPPFVNLQQYLVEWFLVERAYELETVDLRWSNRLLAVTPQADHVQMLVDTPTGRYTLHAQYLVDCSGAASGIPASLGVGRDSERLADTWCISDVRFKHPPAAERWAWIEAPFNEGRAAWQLLLADDVWRLDYQMAPGTDVSVAGDPAIVRDRLQRQFGADAQYELVWVHGWSHRSQCLQSFRAGRVFFAGDAAHLMSPFGARGGNSGVQDAENLGWKLALVLQGKAPEALLDSYDAERRAAALQNLRVSAQTTRFLAPAGDGARQLRRAVLALARRGDAPAFTRALVNSGRPSAPAHYAASPLNDEDAGYALQNVALELPDGTAADLVALFEPGGWRPLVLLFAELDHAEESELRSLEREFPVRLLRVARGDAEPRVLPTAIDSAGHLAAQLPAGTAAAVLRPDLYLAAALDRADADAIEDAVARMLAME